MTRRINCRFWYVGTIALALATQLSGATARATDGAAVLVVNAVDARNDKQIANFKVSLVGMKDDTIAFELQKDGRRRCDTLPADREMTVVVSADGYVPDFDVISLSSAATTEIALKLERAVAIPIAQVTAWSALKSLSKRYRKQNEAYAVALRDAKTPEDRQVAFRNFAPQMVFIDELFKFEERWRGTDEGLVALNCLAQNALLMVYAEDPLFQARERVGEILKAHYISNPRLELILPMFHGSPASAVAEPLFLAARRSPDPRVRAIAIYHQAVFLEEYSASTVGLADLRHSVSRDKNEEHFNRLTAMLGHLAKVGFTPETAPARRQEALELLFELQKDATTIRQRQWFPFLEVLDLMDRIDFNPGADWPTYAKLAERLEFAITALAVGSVVPEIDAQDPAGQPLKLSSFRGKVTVLIFSADWCRFCVAMYPQLRELVEKHGSDRFAVVSVMGDLTIDTVREALAEKKITWPVWWDGGKREIAARWNVKTWPTIFVIDNAGVIRHRDLADERLTVAVDDLLGKAGAADR